MKKLLIFLCAFGLFAACNNAFQKQSKEYGHNQTILKITENEVETASTSVRDTREFNEQMVEACRQGNLEKVRELIKLGADVNEVYTPPNTCGDYEDGCSSPKSQTPLITACQAGHLDIVKELIDAKANVNQSNSAKETPLMFASGGGYNRIVKELLSAGANINAVTSSDYDPNRYKSYTALYFASKNGHLEVVETLLNAKANVNLPNAVSALSAAARYKHLEIVKKLLAAGADINPNNCRHPLSEAIHGGGDIEIVKTLISAGARVDRDGCDTTSPLKWAIYKKQVEIVKLLVKAGASINKKSVDGVSGEIRTALEVAYRIENKKIIEILKKAGGKLDIKNTPALVNASGSGNVEIVKELLAAGVDINLKKEDSPLVDIRCDNLLYNSRYIQTTALQNASEYGHLEVVKILLAAGADVNVKNAIGDTSLMLASKEFRQERKGNYPEIVKILITAGADVNAKNTCGGTALKIAQKNKNEEIIDLLKAAGAKE